MMSNPGEGEANRLLGAWTILTKFTKVITMTLSAIDVDILTAVAKRGVSGITKDELMQELGRSVKGIAYSDLTRHVTGLVESGMVQLEETGPDDFTVMITDAGREAVDV